MVVWMEFGVAARAKRCPSLGERLIPGMIPSGMLAQLWHAPSNQSFYTVRRVPGTFWDVQGAVVHFPNTSEQQRELSRKRVSGGGENYT